MIVFSFLLFSCVKGCYWRIIYCSTLDCTRQDVGAKLNSVEVLYQHALPHMSTTKLLYEQYTKYETKRDSMPTDKHGWIYTCNTHGPIHMPLPSLLRGFDKAYIHDLHLEISYGVASSPVSFQPTTQHCRTHILYQFFLYSRTTKR